MSEPAIGRRSAALLGAAALGVAALPAASFADATDDAIARIAAKNAAAFEKEKEDTIKNAKTAEEIEQDAEDAKNNIILIAGGGTLASTAFFYRNILRLFTKVASGGEDDGYSTSSKGG